MKVEMPGQMQLLARRAYLNSSSHTTFSDTRIHGLIEASQI